MFNHYEINRVLVAEHQRQLEQDAAARRLARQAGRSHRRAGRRAAERNAPEPPAPVVFPTPRRVDGTTARRPAA